MGELVVTFGMALPQSRFGISVPCLVPIGLGLWQINLSDSEPVFLPVADLTGESVLPQDMQPDSKGYFSNSLSHCSKLCVHVLLVS